MNILRSLPTSSQFAAALDRFADRHYARLRGRAATIRRQAEWIDTIQLQLEQIRDYLDEVLTCDCQNAMEDFLVNYGPDEVEQATAILNKSRGE
jgi:hypothetical protein